MNNIQKADELIITTNIQILDYNIERFIKNNSIDKRIELLYYLKKATDIFEKKDKIEQQQYLTALYHKLKTESFEKPLINSLEIIQKKKVNKYEYLAPDLANKLLIEKEQLETRLKEIEERLKQLKIETEVDYVYYVTEPKKKHINNNNLEEF